LAKKVHREPRMSEYCMNGAVGVVRVGAIVSGIEYRRTSLPPATVPYIVRGSN
jgi:hypothetical protein